MKILNEKYRGFLMINQTFSHAATFVSQAASQALQSFNSTQFSRLSQATPLSGTVLLAVAGSAVVLGMGAVAASRYLYSAKPAQIAPDQTARSTTPAQAQTADQSIEVQSAADDTASVSQESVSSKASISNESSVSIEAAHPESLPAQSTPPSVRSLISKFEGTIENNAKARQTPPKNENLALTQSPEIAEKIAFFEAVSSAARAHNAS